MELENLSPQMDGVDISEGGDNPLRSNAVASLIHESFTRAENARRPEEAKWLKAFYNYRGVYNTDTQFHDKEKSHVFIKVTKTKVQAAYGQIVDILFAGQKFPLGVEPTPVPEGVADAVSFDPAKPEGETEEEMGVGFNGDGQDLPPGATRKTIRERLAGLTKLLDPVADKLKEGVGATPSSVTFHPAKAAARKMEKKIHDQLEESSAAKHLCSAALEMPLFGTGILKGPFAEDKEYPNWTDEGVYEPVVKTRPKVEHVSVWDFYPDPDATCMAESEFVIQRHKMSRSQMRKLKKRPLFDHEAIDKCLADGPNYVMKDWETTLAEATVDGTSISRWEVFEYWGYMDRDTLELVDYEIPDEYEDAEILLMNAWVCGGNLLRLTINPFQPQRIPYFSCPYEENPYSIWGVGVAENMEDTQKLMNGFMRLAVDNGVLSSSLIFEVDETNLAPGQDLNIYPGKVFRRVGGPPGQAIFSTKFQNVTGETMMMFDRARQLADESTGLPSFSHGQTGVQGAGRTASGISMLMGAAQGAIRTVVKNIDNYLLRPLGESYFAFNMQFDFDPEIKGDLEIKARGTESLMRNEVRSQRLMQLLQLSGQPTVAPFIKIPALVREIALTMEVDAENFVNDEREAAIQAEIMKASGALQPPAQQQPVGPNGTPSPMNAGPMGNGGGQIAAGPPPAPGDEAFSGPPAPGGMNGQ